jgi:hypothetical protein
MPRYFFNIMEGRSQKLVRDIEGATLADAGEARKEALGLAQDITRHGIHEPTQTWSVIVTDESGKEVLAVPLAEAPPRKSPSAFALGHHIARLEASLGHGTVIWVIGAAALIIAVQVVTTAGRFGQPPASYQTASAVGDGAYVAVRFTAQSSITDIGKFLQSYHASMADGPRPGNLYRLRIGDGSLPQTEIAKIASRMSRDPMIELAITAD